MATERFTGSQTDTQVSAADLTGKEYFACKRTSSGVNLCGANEYADGIISEGKAAGLHTSFKTGNQLKAIAGAAIAIGASVTTDAAGKFVTATTGQKATGRARTAVVGGDGVIFSIDVDRHAAP